MKVETQNFTSLQLNFVEFAIDCPLDAVRSQNAAHPPDSANFIPKAFGSCNNRKS